MEKKVEGDVLDTYRTEKKLTMSRKVDSWHTRVSFQQHLLNCTATDLRSIERDLSSLARTLSRLISFRTPLEPAHLPILRAIQAAPICRYRTVEGVDRSRSYNNIHNDTNRKIFRLPHSLFMMLLDRTKGSWGKGEEERSTLKAASTAPSKKDVNTEADRCIEIEENVSSQSNWRITQQGKKNADECAMKHRRTNQV